MSDILIFATLIIMIIIAIFTILSNDIFAAVIYLGALSFFTAFLYVLLGAPDVALAEAVIGATIVTAIFLITLKKYRIFTIYLTGTNQAMYHSKTLQTIIQTLRKQEIEVHVFQIDKTPKELLAHHNCDLVMEDRETQIVIHAEKGNQYLTRIAPFLHEEIEAGTIAIKEELYDQKA